MGHEVASSGVPLGASTSASINKNADSPEERKWSFVLSSMDGQSGDLYTSVAGIHLPVCTRQQQAAASSSNICCKICFISTVYFICCLATKQPILDANCR